PHRGLRVHLHGNACARAHGAVHEVDEDRVVQRRVHRMVIGDVRAVDGEPAVGAFAAAHHRGLLTDPRAHGALLSFYWVGPSSCGTCMSGVIASGATGLRSLSCSGFATTRPPQQSTAASTFGSRQAAMKAWRPPEQNPMIPTLPLLVGSVRR